MSEELVQALQISAVGVIVVFAVLWLLSLVVSLIAAVFSDRKEEPAEEPEPKTQRESALGARPEREVEAIPEDESVVAAISAVLYALGVTDSSRVRISRVKSPSRGG